MRDELIEVMALAMHPRRDELVEAMARVIWPHDDKAIPPAIKSARKMLKAIEQAGFVVVEKSEIRSVSEALAGYVLALREIDKDQAARGIQDCIDRLERLL